MRIAGMLARRELWNRPWQTVAMTSVAALLITLAAVFGVVGDAQVRGLSGAIAENDADLWVLNAGAQGAFSASRVDRDNEPIIAAVEGVAAVAPLGEVRVGLLIDGAPADGSLWGIDPDSPAAPRLATGTPLSGANDALIDVGAAALASAPGTPIEVVDTGTRLTISGATDGRRFASIPTVTVTYDRWAQIVDALNPDSDEVFPVAVAVSLQDGEDATTVADRIAVATPGLVARTPAQLAAELPGIGGLRSSFGAAALVSLVAAAAVAAAFTRLQIEHERRQYAVLRAIGVGARELTLAHQLRVAVVVLLATIVAAVGLRVAEATTPSQIPVSLDLRTVVTVGLMTWLAAASASALALRKRRRIDPADALQAPA